VVATLVLVLILINIFFRFKVSKIYKTLKNKGLTQNIRTESMSGLSSEDQQLVATFQTTMKRSLLLLFVTLLCIAGIFTYNYLNK